mgnify:CR=1 FL=1
MIAAAQLFAYAFAINSLSEKIEKTLVGFQSWHEYLAETRDQSGYTLGEVEFTPLGILKKSPAALNVTFFRPYLWEARNLPTLLGAIEGLILFFYFVCAPMLLIIVVVMLTNPFLYQVV